MAKELSIRRWAVTCVDYGDSTDGKARILGLYNSPKEAHNAMKADAKRYKKELRLRGKVTVCLDSASVGDTAECGCEYRMETLTIPLLPTDHDVWVH